MISFLLTRHQSLLTKIMQIKIYIFEFIQSFQAIYSSVLQPSVKLFLIYSGICGRKIEACRKPRNKTPDVIYAKATVTKTEMCA